MAKPVFRQYRQHETMVLPPGLDDFIDENHPCRIVSDVIDRLDLSKSEATCKGGGLRLSRQCLFRPADCEAA